MSQAAYVKKAQISTDDGVTWLDLPATAPSLEIGGDVLDDTDLATNASFRSRCYGLNDWSASADSNFKPITGVALTDDANGASALIACRNAKLERTTIKFRYLPTGSAVDGTGLEGDVVVESFGQSGETSGLETISLSFQANGPLAAVA
jgi:hypothetical protein